MDKQSLGKHLRSIRKSKKMSVQKVRDRSGISIHYIYSIENGNQNPSVMTLWKLSEAYNLSLSELLDGYHFDPMPFVAF